MELLTVAFILMVLGTVVFSAAGMVREKADAGTCTSHMRSLHVSFQGYVNDHGHWPQAPQLHWPKEEDMWRFWITELEDYGGSQKYWTCPTHRRYVIQAMNTGDREIPDYIGSFIPTYFDAHESTPFKYPQPWLMERGDFHGEGPKAIMGDGRIVFLPKLSRGAVPPTGS